ncbi:MAG: chromate resistance protein ChrB domain-containing protein [Chloroflexota bacterium]
MLFVTRERLHVDRIATAWAIRRFVDPDATFAFVPRTKDVDSIAGTAFDIRGAELSHRGARCTFEVLIERRALIDPAIDRMGLIIRGADLPHEDASPAESGGVRAVFDGLRDADLSDDERLRIGSAFCDALYAFCSGS